MKPPRDCASMAELREAIDELDRDIVARLAERARYIDRAAELKLVEALPARIDARVEEVVAKVRSEAERIGLDPDLVDSLWRWMIEWSIRREEAVIGPDAEEEQAQ